MKEFHVLLEIDTFNGEQVSYPVELGIGVFAATSDEARMKARAILAMLFGSSSIGAIDHVFDPCPEGL